MKSKVKVFECIKPENANPLTGYRTYGCRCVGPGSCTEANTKGVMRWRRRTGRTTRTLVPVDPEE